MKTVEKILDQARSWLGSKESDGSHKKIIDTYNKQSKLPRGYKVRYTDAWCATFVSACAIACGMTDIIPTECGAQEMINLFKKRGEWIEDESVTPKPGYVIFYAWKDNGVGDNQAWGDHVGFVEKVSNGTITTIEGNYSDSVKRRTIKVNAQYIRGYGAPHYEEESNAVIPEAPKPAESKPVATAGGLSKDPKWTGKVTASLLNVRTWAGIEHNNLKSIPMIAKDNLVDVCDTVKDSKGEDWYYIRINGSIFGFVSAKYIARA